MLFTLRSMLPDSVNNDKLFRVTFRYSLISGIPIKNVLSSISVLIAFRNSSFDLNFIMSTVVLNISFPKIIYIAIILYIYI